MLVNHIFREFEWPKVLILKKSEMITNECRLVALELADDGTGRSGCGRRNSRCRALHL